MELKDSFLELDSIFRSFALMDSKTNKRASKFLSYVLRHHPELINLTLDTQGWANTQELIEKATRGDHVLTFEQLVEIVETNDKQRFSFNEDRSQIRTNQGHSLQFIDLKMETQAPPEILYHGSVGKFVDSIKEHGLQKGSRQYVHLSIEIQTAIEVGSRRGKPVVLTVQAMKMYNAGYQFYLSDNQIWLTEHVPSEFLEFPE